MPNVIRIDAEVARQLAKHGKYGESANAVIRRLIGMPPSAIRRGRPAKRQGKPAKKAHR